MIDAWRELSDDVYGAPAELQEQRYRRVLRRFASERPDQVCRVYRKYSLEAADEFKDGFFDWVYVDADHNYEACLADLRRWSPKISSGGLICGHDFAVRPGRPNYGVVEAVTTFLMETGYYMAAVTIEPSPSFVIAKSPDSACFMRFRELLFTFEPHLVRVGWDAARIHQMTKLKNCAGAAALMTLSVRSAQDDPHLASRL